MYCLGRCRAAEPPSRRTAEPPNRSRSVKSPSRLT
ncbi:molecular chaperone GroEL [Burkholderia pseudomallei]|nr:molecular chaperone GroEL [Burkholderia pseudomallei]